MTARPAVYVTRKLPDAVTARLAHSYDARLNPEDTVHTISEVISGAAGADALLVCPTDKLTAEAIEVLPRSIRIVAPLSVAFEHTTLGAAKGRRLVVPNTPDVPPDATADIAMLLLLGAARRAHEGEQIIRQDSWNSWGTTYMLGVHLTGKRLGILGMG